MISRVPQGLIARYLEAGLSCPRRSAALDADRALAMAVERASVRAAAGTEVPYLAPGCGSGGESH